MHKYQKNIRNTKDENKIKNQKLNFLKKNDFK